MRVLEPAAPLRDQGGVQQAACGTHVDMRRQLSVSVEGRQQVDPLRGGGCALWLQSCSVLGKCCCHLQCCWIAKGRQLLRHTVFCTQRHT